MELLQAAIHNNDFGLRQRFRWSSINIESNKLKSDINWFERNYLTDLLKPVFPIGGLNIERIENPYLWGRYVLQYEEMKAEIETQHVKEQIMIHGTSASNAYSIAENNFDWRFVNRARFGEGISFTSDAGYAERWATESSVYIVAGILIANSSPGGWYQKIPNNGEDTTTGFTTETCIKYYDNDFYPYYIVQR